MDERVAVTIGFSALESYQAISYAQEPTQGRCPNRKHPFVGLLPNKYTTPPLELMPLGHGVAVSRMLCYISLNQYVQTLCIVYVQSIIRKSSFSPNYSLSYCRRANVMKTILRIQIISVSSSASTFATCFFLITFKNDISCVHRSAVCPVYSPFDDRAPVAPWYAPGLPRSRGLRASLLRLAAVIVETIYRALTARSRVRHVKWTS